MVTSLTRSDDVAVLMLGDDEVRMSPEWLTEIHQQLDVVEEWGSAALVTSSAGRFFSNGLDLEWLGSNLDQYESYLGEVQTLMARFLTFPMPTVAAIPGHAFGMGALLALMHDFRVMREDRGYFCFPEVDLKLPFSPGMVSAIRAKLPAQTALEAMSTGRRYGGADAAKAAIVDDSCSLDDLLTEAKALSSRVGPKDPGALAAIKLDLYRDVVAALGSRAA